MALPKQLVDEFDELVKNYPERRAALIVALHRCQEELGGWISPQTMEDLGAYFGLEPVEVFGVASFYPMFHLRPVGKHVVSICHNISCDLRGAQDIIAKVCEVTGAPLGGTSKDGQWTVKHVECQGACANAPMLDLDGTYHEDLTPEKVAQLLGAVR
ncbi:MAG: NAD(P)H-dependent oxidoreductase subunit E [Planctomycetes bacterium]|nr:NAD(P)H-dependent oxidoreductase subunit E [Planctomycetota bacterium]